MPLFTNCTSGLLFVFVLHSSLLGSNSRIFGADFIRNSTYNCSKRLVAPVYTIKLEENDEFPQLIFDFPSHS
uniref:Putative secreted protein n=1 Tax=Anopheles triannulatus TaxID=58253 RepID=A0A2M4B2W9_9DIPT